jgi:phage tail tape-measure protein
MPMQMASSGFSSAAWRIAPVEAATRQLAHAVADRTDAGEDHAIGAGDDCRVAGDQHLHPGRDMLQGLGDRVQVAHAVVDDRDALHRHGARACPWWTA